MSDYISNITVCVQALNEQLPVVLIYYSHIPIIVLCIFLTLFLLIQRNKTPQTLLFVTLNLLFSLWVMSDLATWVLLYDSRITMFAWSTMELIETSFFFVALNFGYHFFFSKSIPLRFNSILALPLLLIFYFTVTGDVIHNYNIVLCEATENAFVASWLAPLIDLLYFIALTVVTFWALLKNRVDRVKNGLFAFGLLSFLLLYQIFNFISDYSNDYNWSLLTLAGMPVFLAVIGFSAVRYHLFNLKIIGTEMFVFIFIFVTASQFAFIQSTVNMYLNGGTTIMLLIGGYFLIRSVKRVEAQRIALANANLGQENFIHFLSHEIKGYLTVARNGYASIVEGDYGNAIPPALLSMSGNALKRLNDGVMTVENILKSANLKSGKVTFDFESINLRNMVMEKVEATRAFAEERGLTLAVVIPEGKEYVIRGDKENLKEHVFKNIIENAVHYTEKGTVTVSLERKQDSVLFSVHDTGVGITEEDKARLFTEGGRGANSMKMNIHSTGHGLFIAKNIVLAHKGRIWAESAGVGQGATFIVELPVV